MQLQLIDWIVILASLAVCFTPALFLGAASKNTSEFFVSAARCPGGSRGSRWSRRRSAATRRTW
jgi:hypothetical protein